MDKKTIRKNILEIRNSLENKLEKEKKMIDFKKIMAELEKLEDIVDKKLDG